MWMPLQTVCDLFTFSLQLSLFRSLTYNRKKKHQVNDASIVIKRRSEESNYICEYCENKLALCIDPCFRLHHSNLQIKIPNAVEDEGNNMV